MNIEDQSVTISVMKHKNQNGAAQTSVVVAVLMTMLFIFALIFGLLMFAKKSDLQKNIDKKVEAQMVIESKKIEAQKDAELAEKEKSPVKTYVGPSTFGSVTFDYPKTYSGYVVEATGSGGTPLEGFFHPNIVPKEDKSVSFAIRFELVSASYDAQVKSFDSSVKSSKVTVKPYRAAMVPDVLGVRIDGEIINGKQGSLILLAVRDKTLRLWTESKDTLADFEKYVLPNLSFSP